MSIVNFTNDLVPFMELESEDGYGNISRMHDSIEKFVKSYCGRSFESANFKEEFIHNDITSLWLTETPITKITKIALGTDDALRIWNTNTATTAVINVSTTEIVLTYNGTDDNADLTFATNTDMDAMVTAINAIGSGWQSEAVGSFGSYKTTELLPRYGAEAIDTTNVYLRVPAQALTNFDVDTESGEITRYSGFMGASRGTRGNSYIDGNQGFYSEQFNYNNPALAHQMKIYAHYAGGYTAALMPKDLKLAVMIIVKAIYQRIEEESFSLSSYSISDIDKTIDTFPKEAVMILDSYKRWGI